MTNGIPMYQTKNKHPMLALQERMWAFDRAMISIHDLLRSSTSQLAKLCSPSYIKVANLSALLGHGHVHLHHKTGRLFLPWCSDCCGWTSIHYNVTSSKRGWKGTLTTQTKIYPLYLWICITCLPQIILAAQLNIFFGITARRCSTFQTNIAVHLKPVLADQFVQWNHLVR